MVTKEEFESKIKRYQETLSMNISALMAKHKHSMYRVSKETGITDASLGLNLKNKGNWLAWQIMAIADFYNVTLSDLAKVKEVETLDKESQIKQLENKASDLERENRELKDKLNSIIGIAK